MTQNSEALLQFTKIINSKQNIDPKKLEDMHSTFRQNINNYNKSNSHLFSEMKNAFSFNSSDIAKINSINTALDTSAQRPILVDELQAKLTDLNTLIGISN
jgi:arsenate reductase-like glutaredoxin family protein